MRPASKGELIRAGEGKTYPIGDHPITVKVRADDTENKYEIIEYAVRPGFNSSFHVHQRAEEVFYLLEGELEFKLNEQTVRGRAGDLVRVPRGVSHGFTNPTKVKTKVLEVRTGGGYGQMLEELTQAFPSGTPIDPERLDMIMRRYDSVPTAPHATTRE